MGVKISMDEKELGTNTPGTVQNKEKKYIIIKCCYYGN